MICRRSLRREEFTDLDRLHVFAKVAQLFLFKHRGHLCMLDQVEEWGEEGTIKEYRAIVSVRGVTRYILTFDHFFDFVSQQEVPDE